MQVRSRANSQPERKADLPFWPDGMPLTLSLPMKRRRALDIKVRTAGDS